MEKQKRALDFYLRFGSTLTHFNRIQFDFDIAVLTIKEGISCCAKDGLEYLYSSDIGCFRIKWITDNKYLIKVAEESKRTSFHSIERGIYKKYFINKLFEEMKKTNFISELKNIIMKESKKRLELLSELEREVINNG